MVDYMKILEENKDSISEVSYKKLQRHLGKKIVHKFVSREGDEDTFHFIPATYELYVEFMGLSSMLDEGKTDKDAMEGAMQLMITVVKMSYPDWPDEICKQFAANNFESMMDVLSKIMPQDKGDVKDIKKIQKQLKFMKESRKEGKGGKNVKDPEPEEQSPQPEQASNQA